MWSLDGMGAGTHPLPATVGRANCTFHLSDLETHCTTLEEKHHIIKILQRIADGSINQINTKRFEP